MDDPITYRGGHMQIIACAGSGKTEAIARRAASLIEEEEEPAAIVAFTFTEKAAAELKSRITRRVQEVKGDEFLDRLSPMFVGTIHAYCFRLLQENVPKYGAYDMLNEHQVAALINREFWRLGLGQIREQHCRNYRWLTTDRFLANVDLVENELMAPEDITDPYFSESYRLFCDCLEDLKLLTFGRQVAHAVRALADPQVYGRVHGRLKHLIVDEYQDINPAQEKLISMLASDPVQLCVVGDDDQCIYQWRGSDVGNILTFAQRYPGVRTFTLNTNRRSRPGIIAGANAFSRTIRPRLPKEMQPYRSGNNNEICVWSASTPEEEASRVADHIESLVRGGRLYRDIAILFRSTAVASKEFVRIFQERRIPYECAGRSGLFRHPEAQLFAALYSFLAGREWKLDSPDEMQVIQPELHGLVEGFRFLFPEGRFNEIQGWIERTQREAQSGSLYPNLLEDYYGLLNMAGVPAWDLEEEERSARMGVLARMANVLQDFEHVKRRVHRRFFPKKFLKTENKEAGKDPVEETSRVVQYYRNLHGYLQYYATRSYDQFEGEDPYRVDAVTISTVHAAKGLEWPVVFLPSLTSKRFPSMRTGQQQIWFLKDDQFPRARYEGSDTDERRLFYVGMTRARDALYLSCFRRMGDRDIDPSPYLEPLNQSLWKSERLPLPAPADDMPPPDIPPPTFSFSNLALHEQCPYTFRLRELFQFGPPLAEAIGYGRAVHHVLRRIADETRENGRIPTQEQVESFFDQEFYLPFADADTYLRARTDALRLVERYLTEHSDDLHRTWETERAFELHLGHANIVGRADVILDREGGEAGKMAIVDYKTATHEETESIHRFQLEIYTHAGRGEGIDVRAAYIHDLKRGERMPVDVSDVKVRSARLRAATIATAILTRQFPLRPGLHCSHCDVRLLCRYGPAPSG